MAEYFTEELNQLDERIEKEQVSFIDASAGGGRRMS